MSLKHFLLFPSWLSLFRSFLQLGFSLLGDGGGGKIRVRKASVTGSSPMLIWILVLATDPLSLYPSPPLNLEKGLREVFRRKFCISASIKCLTIQFLNSGEVEAFWWRNEGTVSKIMKGDSCATEVIHWAFGCDTLSSRDLKGLEPGKWSIVAT